MAEIVTMLGVGWVKNKNILLITKIIILFIVYYSTAKLGLSFDALNGFAALIWLPSGIALTSLFLFGYELWPGIATAAFFANLTTGAHPLVALGIGIGNTLEAIMAVYILRKINFQPSLATLKDVLFLTLIAAPIAASVSATIGVSSLQIGHAIAFSSFNSTWRAWFTGDVISMVVIPPLIFVWRTFPKVKFKYFPEFIVLIGYIAISTLIVFSGLFGIFPAGSPITFLMFPPLLWASLRFGLRGAISTVVVISFFAISQTLYSHGPFGNGGIIDRLFLLQTFIGVIALTSMAITAIDAERKKLDARKDEFISLASHELKTPLTTVKLFNQLLQRIFPKTSSKKEAYYLEKMNMQLNQLQILVDDLLDMSKVQRGKLEFHEDYFSLPERVAEIIDDIQEITPSHTILLKNHIGKDNHKVHADKDRISQVLINLLTNAVKYSPKAKKIIVTLATTDHSLLVSVKDFGIGMTEEAQKKIFQRYYREQDNTNNTIPGLGIGLYISHEIVKRSKGKMWVESTKGKGSTFYFSLPATRPGLFF